ncbi:hypothetical protein C495_03777 [Natronorubrum sulfidifaciens JCM 14089]|uniref:Uncharacterized protein n=1 Tax=Natronorubrum sulfidifaciens JCM 14089 TaxID=1230460 RepID=L9WDB4_9EURY|nr:hypothetical protein C495_03777 [Natronorubrum sulfidifaciens JCM 14089]
MCPECEDEGGKHTIPAWTDEIGDEVCPVCGMICNGNRKQMWPEDFNFESRGGFESSGFPALNDSAPRFGPDTPMDSADLYPGGESNEA